MELKTKDSLLKIEKSFWLDRLKNKESDWATNIILYYLYERDAAVIAIVEEDKRRWLTIKDDEIKYWTKFLQDR